ncbi:MAG: hypothetical protein K8R21_14205 [Leptospira sp.]|nr:hypothetical protein [Leptospira sp.]
MLTFFTIMIALVTVAFFLYALSAIDGFKITKMEKTRLNAEDNFLGADPKKVYGKDWDKAVPRPRICPICGTALRKSEFLYAAVDEFVSTKQKKQVHIYGCRYCYLGQVDAAQSKAITQPTETLDI